MSENEASRKTADQSRPLVHTPGPWKMLPEECDKPYIRIRGDRLGGRYKVANVITPVYKGVGSREAEETRANASLIAAAPELLDVLQRIRGWDHLGTTHDGPYWKSEIDKVLSKVV